MKISFVIASAMLAAACLADDARFSAYVVDEVSGEPISGARVKSWFEMDIGWRAWSESPPIVTDEGVTDIKGSCRQRGKTNTGGITCHAEKPGEYYRGVFFKKLESKNFWGIWQPDNLVATIRLQRVEHPIPLFVRNVGDHINRSKAGRWNGTNMVLRYDFVKGDYLPPDGNGEVADIVVDSRVTYLESTNVYGEAKTFFDITNVFSFPGEGNGLIPIITKPTDGIKLRIAPVNGYENDFALKCGTRKQVSGPNLFRLSSLVSSWKSEKLYQDGARVVLCGKTNAGKSSLFNALLKEERAIVSDIAGTTRDWLESWASFDGIPVRLFDTAGLRETSDVIEQKGVELTKDLSNEADVILYLVDARFGLDENDNIFLSIKRSVPVVLVWNKCDADGAKEVPDDHADSRWSACVRVYEKKGDGLGSLTTAVKQLLAVGEKTDREQAGLGSARQKASVAEALERVDHALEAEAEHYSLDAVVQDLEDSLDSLGEVTGEVTPDDVLGSIFSHFCVGK